MQTTVRQPGFDKAGAKLIRTIHDLVIEINPDQPQLADAIRRAVRVGWGEEAEARAFDSPEDAEETIDQFNKKFNEMVKENGGEKIEVPEAPTMMQMGLSMTLSGRLRFLIESGRATPAEVYDVARRPTDRQKTFLESREALPAHTFDSGGLVDDRGNIRMSLTVEQHDAELVAQEVWAPKA